MDFMNWLWRIKICKLDLVWRWFWNAEIGNFWVPQLFSKKVTSVGLNSLQQKGYQISVKIWIFDDPFHKKEPLLVILVPGMIQPSGSAIFSMKWGCRGHWGHWGCWGCWGHWGCRGSKASKITPGDFRVIQVLEFSFILMLWKNIFGG